MKTKILRTIYNSNQFNCITEPPVLPPSKPIKIMSPAVVAVCSLLYLFNDCMNCLQ